jgi:3-phytase
MFPTGLFVCQDNTNTAPGSSGNQNFKLLQLGKAVTL